MLAFLVVFVSVFVFATAVPPSLHLLSAYKVMTCLDLRQSADVAPGL